MAKAYEMMMILAPLVSAKEEEAIVARVKKSFSNGKNVVVSQLGQKTLSYPIQKNSQGKFVLLKFTGEGSEIVAIGKNLKHQSQILRYLIIKTDTVNKPAKKVKEILPDRPLRRGAGRKGKE